MEISRMLNLPVELRSAILRQLPRVEDVWSAIQSNKSLYEALLEDTTIVSYVFHKQVDAKLLQYAATFLELDKTPQIKRSHKDISTTLKKCFSLTQSQASEELALISLREALHLMNLHRTIQKFATKYSTQALALLQDDELLKGSVLSFTPSEIHRIERSFYTVELYCSLFGQSRPRLSLADQIDLFFKRFTPWENEQLSCVHDFLKEEFKPAFNEVAAHDIQFGELSISWTEDTSWLLGFVSLGMRYLDQVITASTYDERHRLLEEKLLNAFKEPTLADCLFESNDLYLGETDELDDYAIQQFRQFASQYCACEADADTGPEEIWYQAHEGDHYTRYVSAESYLMSRKIGYVMMDLSRKKDMASFDGPRKWMEQDVFDEEAFSQEMAQQQKSFAIRSDIFLHGGRGWWSEDDTSRIQWHDPSTMKPLKAPEGLELW
ncbi:hypothetical protein N7454_007023 [Penicillium verhagenii]|nr:hypothetical protein N7454_007023 [Penicillium verhagenii]